MDELSPVVVRRRARNSKEIFFFKRDTIDPFARKRISRKSLFAVMRLGVFVFSVANFIFLSANNVIEKTFNRNYTFDF